MSFLRVRSSVLMTLPGDWIRSVIWVMVVVLMTAGHANAEMCNASQCARPVDTISRTVDSTVSDECFDDDTTIIVLCNRGFQRQMDSYTATCNNYTGEFKPEGSCELDLLTLIISVLLMMVVTVTFVLLAFLVCKRYTKRRKKAMYDTSHDVSDVIDGYDEKDGVVNIGMTELPPSPRVIPINFEDPYETGSEVEIQTSQKRETEAEVHYASSSVATNREVVQYANASAVIKPEVQYANSSTVVDTEDMIDGYGYGVINENGMLPRNPETGSSTEKLIDTERDEPDGQASSLDPYASIDRPVSRARRGPSDASVGGSERVRPVTAPPEFSDRSASVKTSVPYDGVEALYAKINKVKRTSERWPPKHKDPSRPRGRPADIDDLLNHIDKPSKKRQWNGDSPTRPRAGARKVEDLYAEVSDGSSAKQNPPPTAPKPVRKSTKTPGDLEIKRYAQPSRASTQTGSADSNNVMSAKGDSSMSSTNRNIFDVNFGPPSPPPIDGVNGLYAQIDRDRRSSNDLIQS